MSNKNLTDTQPLRRNHKEPGETRPVLVHPNRKPKKGLWLWALISLTLIIVSTGIGGLAGYQSGNQERKAWEQAQGKQAIQEQFDLGVQDLSAGRYDVARQRFEYVLSQDPTFPDATEKLAQTIQVLYATATPTPLPPTFTPTPTRDLQPVQDLLKQAQAFIADQDWNRAINTLSALRDTDPNFQVTKVDGMLYLALRNRGVDNIMHNKDLEGGTYDLALAERFGPLDVEATQARNLARLYMYGSSFWEAYPEQAVYYFSQVAAAAPYLTDASGWTARERYRSALIQYGDQFAANEDWCKAEAQYEQALAIRSDDKLQETVTDAALKCSPPTDTPTATATFTPTLTATLTPTMVILPSATPTLVPSQTATPTQEQPTATQHPAITPATTIPPTVTPIPSTQPPPTETPVPATETAPVPSETIVPATETPVPPTETPSLSTDTPIPPTNTPESATETPIPPKNSPVATTETPAPATDEPTTEIATSVPSTGTPVSDVVDAISASSILKSSRITSPQTIAPQEIIIPGESTIKATISTSLRSSDLVLPRTSLIFYESYPLSKTTYEKKFFRSA